MKEMCSVRALALLIGLMLLLKSLIECDESEEQIVSKLCETQDVDRLPNGTISERQEA